MEKKDWREKLRELCLMAYMHKSEQVVMHLPSLEDFISSEIEKAERELFTKKELEILLHLVKLRNRDMNRMWVRKTLPNYEIEVSRNLVKKLEDLSKLKQ